MTVTHPVLLAAEGSFGLNANFLESNLINLVIVIGVLIWFLRGFLGNILTRRRQTILQELADAEVRLEQANVSLSRAQADLATAQQKADVIRADGKARAESIRTDGERRTIEAMASLKDDALADMSAEGERLIEELRREAAIAAISKAVSELPGHLDDDSQVRLIDISISNLENC